MKYRIFNIAAAIFVGCWLVSFASQGNEVAIDFSNESTTFEENSPEEDQSALKDKVLLQAFKMMLDRIHFSPKEVDDDFSSEVFDLYIKRLDYQKRFFLQSDIEEFEKYRDKLDDAIAKEDFTFFNLTNDVLTQRIQESEDFYKDILCNPFDFNKNESTITDRDERDYSESKKDLQEHWRKSLKMGTMTRLSNKLKAQEEAIAENDTSVTIKTFEELEDESRNKVYTSYENFYNRLRKLKRSDRLNTYFNSIANVYDTHTGYFPPKKKEDFDIRLSGKLEGIGATLQQQDEYIKVVNIVPGSPCWKQGDLEVDDKILAVAQGDDDPVDVVDMRLDEAVLLIRGKKGTTVNLTVKKKDNSTQIIPIVRDVVVIEETYAKSVIIESDESKLGYIYLPKFYADFKNPQGRRCSTDIKAELEKLEDESVKGIILDLRGNGGGSLQDVVDMTGYFVEKGPIVQVKPKTGNPKVYQDRDPNIYCDKPLIVMVDDFSASASEILAAAIQDYGRGVIIGSPSTYGKGTVQRFFDLDNTISKGYDEIKPLGAIKMTTQKFYRIDGSSTQLKGVEPDIILPGPYHYIETGEKEQDYALEWDEIRSMEYKKWNTSYKMDDLRDKSANRINQNDFFNLVDTNAKRLKEKNERKSLTLNLEDYRKEVKQDDEQVKKFEEYEDKELDGLTFSYTTPDRNEIEKDEATKERFEDFMKTLKTDVYLEEAVAIMEDILR